ncbi:hypothetical protein [Chitinophaga sp. 212800010-3]|uniref:hypothetical protein n=1 Tax=unclassified Chitinophaga TaxID=2619133 RepID=UPI002E14E83E
MSDSGHDTAQQGTISIYLIKIKPKTFMTDYRYYQQISPNVYKRKSLNSQFVIVAALLFAVGAWFFLKRAPQVEAYIFSGILFIFGCCFIVKMFSSVVIDGNSQLITQKSGLLSSKRTMAFADIQSFSLSNQIYVLILISSAYAIVNRSNKQEPVLLGTNLMNVKNSEALLLETEKILGRR